MLKQDNIYEIKNFTFFKKIEVKMRLSDRTIQKLYHALESSFGNFPMYLFASRMNDEKRGGDINLALDLDLPKNEFAKKKIKFKSALLQAGFDEIDVDIVSYHPTDALLAKEIQQKAILIEKS